MRNGDLNTNYDNNDTTAEINNDKGSNSDFKDNIIEHLQQ